MTWHRVAGRSWRAGWLALLVGLAAVVGLLAGCGQLPGFPGSGSGQLRLDVQPPPGSAPISPVVPVGVSVADGVLRDVALIRSGGEAVAGTLSPDRTRWTPSGPLAYGASYSWQGTAVGGDGRTAKVTGSFRTVDPVSLTGARLNIADGSQVGVAAPIIVQFDSHVVNRAAAERALSVSTSEPTAGGWGWLQDDLGGSRVFWRPQTYWKPGTSVTVAANLYGVDLGKGAFGEENVRAAFTIGRAQITKADVRSHQLVVLRDGVEVARYDASYGKDADPKQNTRSGIHVITERFPEKRMISREYNYDVVHKWSVRISNNGEFIHSNPGTVGPQGSVNVSHGCVNLSTADAKAYFDSVFYGDPVEVTGSAVPLSAKDGDIWIWTLDWPAWQKLSAIERAN